MGFLRWNSVLFKFTMSMRFLWETSVQILLRMYHVPLARGQQTEQQIKTVLCYGGSGILNGTRSPQGLYNWAARDVTNPNLSPLLSLTFQVISGTSQIFRLLNPRDKKRYYAAQYFNFSVTLLRYGLKILTDSWIEGDSLGYPDHPPRRCHPGRQPTFIHFFTNTLKCLHGRLAG